MSSPRDPDVPPLDWTDGAVDRLVETRRHLHAHPELSNEEYETSRFISERLEAIGIDTIDSVDETGIVALVEGAGNGPTLAWRADIDALPIQEVGDASYKSRHDGVMHACGHDVHTTIGLGIAEALYARRDQLQGDVKLIFQPAEEATPEDEPIGAEKLAQEGVLEEPTVDGIFALHCMPKLEAGRIGYTGGNVWAGSDLVDITIDGTQAHGAMPHEGVDAGLVASQVVVSLQSVVSRRLDARDSCVLSMGSIEAGNSYNVLPERAEMTGILRAFAVETLERAHEEIRRLVANVCRGFGATCEVEFTPGARPVTNDDALESTMVEALQSRWGDDVIVEHPPQLAAEDFAAFSNRVPGCYLFLGIRNEARGITHGLHTPEFDVDERCLAFGTEAISDALIEVASRW